MKGLLDDGQRKSDVLLRGFGPSSLDFELGVWVGPELVSKPARVRSMCLWALEEELTARGIEIPYPQSEIRIRSVKPADSGAGVPGMQA